MNIKIKEVSISKINDVVDLFDKYMIFYEQESNPNRYKIYLENRINNKEAIIYVAYDSDTKPIGFVLNYHSFSSVSLGKIIVLNDLFVLEDYRKYGVGNKLIDCSINFAKETGAVRVDLGTAKDNFEAQSLYEKIGFIKDTEYFSYSFNIYNT